MNEDYKSQISKYHLAKPPTKSRFNRTNRFKLIIAAHPYTFKTTFSDCDKIQKIGASPREHRYWGRGIYHEGGTYRRESPKVGRNQPCSCGSELKYKKCCLNKK